MEAGAIWIAPFDLTFPTNVSLARWHITASPCSAADRFGRREAGVYLPPYLTNDMVTYRIVCVTGVTLHLRGAFAKMAKKMVMTQQRFGAMKEAVIAAVAMAALVASLASPAFAAEGVWAKKAPLAVAMAEVGVAEIDGQIYTVGGTEQREKAAPNWASTLNFMYDPALGAWQAKAPLPHGLTHVGVAALGGKLYAIGGFTNAVHMNAQDSAFVYTPRANTWKALPKLPTARGSVAAVAIDGKLHVFGGRRSDQVVKVSPPGAPEMFQGFGTVGTHDIYDPATGKWSQGAPIPGPGRDHVGVAALNGKVHLFGGRTADVSDNLDRHDVYNPKTDAWTTAAPLPTPRSAGAYTVLEGRIIYAGGECKPGGAPFSPNTYNDVTAYDQGTDRWTSLTPLPQGRHAFGAATVHDIAYFVGGAPVCAGGAMTDILALTLRE